MADDPKIRDDDSSYDPSTPEANRSIEQGNGVGARDLAAQREPSEAPEHDPFIHRPESNDEDDAAEEPTGPGFP